MSAGATLPVTLTPEVQQAITEQQTKVWRLRCLAECIALACEHGNKIADLEACLFGLVDLANSIHLALDPQTLIQTADEIKCVEEKRLDTEGEL